MTYDITDAAPELKVAFALPREDDDELRNTFEEFKSANDERIARARRRAAGGEGRSHQPGARCAAAPIASRRSAP
jgi:hypothetical protein